MKRDTVGAILAVAVLGLGGFWVYQVWKKNGGSLAAVNPGGVFNSILSQEVNPYVGSLTAANEGVAAGLAKGDPTLNRTIADILGSPVPLPGYKGMPAVTEVTPEYTNYWG